MMLCTTGALLSADCDSSGKAWKEHSTRRSPIIKHCRTPTRQSIVHSRWHQGMTGYSTCNLHAHVVIRVRNQLCTTRGRNYSAPPPPSPLDRRFEEGIKHCLLNPGATTFDSLLQSYSTSPTSNLKLQQRMSSDDEKTMLRRMPSSCQTHTRQCSVLRNEFRWSLD
jgi:hypothetical protein